MEGRARLPGPPGRRRQTEPPPLGLAVAAPARQHRLEGPGQRGLVAGRHQQGRPPGQLGHGRALRGDQGRPAGQGLEGGQAVALLDRGVGDDGGRAQQGGHRCVGHVAGAHQPVGQAGLPHRPVHRRGPPARAAGQHEHGLGLGPPQAGERPNQGGDVLAGLDRAEEEDVGAVGVDAGPGHLGPVRPGGGLGRPEPGVVDAVGGHHHRPRRGTDLGQPPGGRRAHADHRRGPAGGHPDGPAEEDHLGPLVPLGVVEEGAVVDRHHHRHPSPLGHRVVGAVVDRRPAAAHQTAEARLLPGQAEGTRARGHGEHLGPVAVVFAERLPARRVGAAGEEHQVDVGAPSQGPGQLEGVAAGPGRGGRHRRDVEGEPQRPRRAHRRDRQSSRWRPAASRHVLDRTRSSPRRLSSSRPGPSVAAATSPPAMSSVEPASTISAAGPSEV